MISKIIEIISKYTKTEEEGKGVYENLKSYLEKFPKLFPEQSEILHFLYHSHSKIKIIESPTGSGKTLVYILYALSKSFQYDHIIISTFTKNLQEQIVSETRKYFPEVEPIVLMGKSNYICQDKLSFLSENEKEIIKTLKPKYLFQKVSVNSYYCNKNYQAVCPFHESCQYLNLINSLQNQKFIIMNHYLLPSVLKKFQESKILLIIDECHLLPKQKIVEVSPDDFNLPEEPDPKKFSSLKEYNLAYEKYMIKLEKFNLIKEYHISSPGKHEIQVSNHDILEIPKEILLFSATVPEELISENSDFLQLQDKKSWSGIKIVIKNVNYKENQYLSVLSEIISYALKSYCKTIILATSYQQLEKIKKAFPECQTNIENKAFSLVEKLKSGKVKLIAGTDVFWTGIDVPGKKCIKMTKLPFPVPTGDSEEDEEKKFVTGVQQMLNKFKQGIGRMLRSSQCSGEIFILDNRVRKYQEVITFLEDLQKKGATVVYEQ